MKRTVQFFIHQGRIEVPATPNNYGEILVTNTVNPQDQRRMTVYTHYKQSFIWDYINNEPMFNNQNQEVFFFLVPMEYLFSAERQIGAIEDTPFLAVNINDTYPFVRSLGNGEVTRKPCTTALTISSDSFESYPATELPMSLFLLSPFYLNHLIRRLFHRRRRFIYGINDYGELTIIDISSDQIERNNIRPWCKIVLRPQWHPTVEFFSQTYSPKRRRKENSEYKIFVQKFDRVDPDWDWVIDQPFQDQPVIKPPFQGRPIDDFYNPNLVKNNPKYPGINQNNRWLSR